MLILLTILMVKSQIDKALHIIVSFMSHTEVFAEKAGIVLGGERLKRRTVS